MSPLPPPTTPLNQHSLRALEEWLHGLEANRSMAIAAAGLWSMRPGPLSCAWNVRIWLWSGRGLTTRLPRCSLPYGLSRLDVNAAIEAGP